MHTLVNSYCETVFKKKPFSVHSATNNGYTVALSNLGIIDLFIVLRLLQVNGANDALSLMHF